MNTKIIWAIVLVVVAGASFWAGSASAGGKTATRGGYAAAGKGGQFVTAGGMGGRAAGNAIGGQIIALGQGSVSVKLPDGSTEIVLIATSTPIVKAVAGSTADLTVGADIAAQGSGNGDGSFTASSVQIRPAGGAGFGARGGGG